MQGKLPVKKNPRIALRYLGQSSVPGKNKIDSPDVAAAPAFAAQLPKALHARVLKRLTRLDKTGFVARMWVKDPILWTPEASHHAEIRDRLGWLRVPRMMENQMDEIDDFVQEVRQTGFTHVLLLGMGGSSLCPEVLRATFGVASGFLDLAILDSTDPVQVERAARWSDPAKTLYIVASKSGSTTEPNMFFAFFWDKVKALRGADAGQHFIAITDPGTKMERVAREHGFRQVFLNPPDIGGRYSALSYFGLVPAALIGMDVPRFLKRAGSAMDALAPDVRAQASSALQLGAILGEAALMGRDKLTLICSPALASLGCWVEQLVAESTGKSGRGIVPIEGEPVGAPDSYGRDRLFLYIHLAGEENAAVDAIRAAGAVMLTITLNDLYDLGGEFFRFEVATAVAGACLQIDAFDQPNVQESKDKTVQLLAEQARTGVLPLTTPVWQRDGVEIRAQKTPAGLRAARRLSTALAAQLARIKPGDYLALNAYVPRAPDTVAQLNRMRTVARDHLRVATTVGFGPRFLHSTGQLHKGGANNGVFIQITCGHPQDLPIPGERISFGVLEDAQSLGDLLSLEARRRRVITVRLPEAGALVEFAQAFEEAVASLRRRPARVAAPKIKKRPRTKTRPAVRRGKSSSRVRKGVR
jgi:glucose-6-phosphate isomerase